MVGAVTGRSPREISQSAFRAPVARRELLETARLVHPGAHQTHCVQSAPCVQLDSIAQGSNAQHVGRGQSLQQTETNARLAVMASTVRMAIPARAVHLVACRTTLREQRLVQRAGLVDIRTTSPSCARAVSRAHMLRSALVRACVATTGTVPTSKRRRACPAAQAVPAEIAPAMSVNQARHRMAIDHTVKHVRRHQEGTLTKL